MSFGLEPLFVSFQILDMYRVSPHDLIWVKVVDLFLLKAAGLRWRKKKRKMQRRAAWFEKAVVASLQLKQFHHSQKNENELSEQYLPSRILHSNLPAVKAEMSTTLLNHDSLTQQGAAGLQDTEHPHRSTAYLIYRTSSSHRTLSGHRCKVTINTHETELLRETLPSDLHVVDVVTFYKSHIFAPSAAQCGGYLSFPQR